MASMVAGGLFNAVAFAGAGFLFSKLNRRGYEEEMRKHNKAMEETSQARFEWSVRQSEKREMLERKREEFEKRRRELRNARDDEDAVNDALHNYRTVYEDYIEHNDQVPKISDYYKPSDEMKGYENIVLGTIGLGGGWLLSKMVL